MHLDYSGNGAATIKLGTVLIMNPNAVAGTTYTMDVQVWAGGTLQQTVNLPVKLSATPDVWPTWPPVRFQYVVSSILECRKK